MCILLYRVVLFVDEADAFLRKRSKVSEYLLSNKLLIVIYNTAGSD